MEVKRSTWFAILMWSILWAAPAADVRPEEVVVKVDEYMQACAKRDHFSGSILVARDGRILFAKGYGLSDREHGVPNTLLTKFRIGSMTKQFTAMAVMILQERGKLDVRDKVKKYLVDCPKAWDDITIHHLLIHTSGLPNFTDFPGYSRTSMMPSTVEQTIAQFRDKPMEFAPGERFKYSNSGYVVLEALIEKASAATYENFMHLAIFEPLRMQDTGCDHSEAILIHRALGYALRGDTVINAPYIDTSGPHANGGLYSTVEDLLLWDRALVGETLVPRRAIERIFTPDRGAYGYGWFIGTRFGRKTYSHGGGISGFSTRITRYPDDGLCVIVLSNFITAPVQGIDRDLAAIAFGRPYEVPRERKAIALESKILDTYVGRYNLPPATTLTVTRQGSRLMVRTTGDAEDVEVFPESETSFFFKGEDVRIEFFKDSSGRVNRLTVHDDGRDYPGPKIEPEKGAEHR